ncbi:MAG: hypothetical protein OQK05_11695 [Pseudopelagicola sp.]|nr:hypothetical protein [Pseudopelagicola sp.]
MTVSLMPQSPVGIIADAWVFRADWFALQPLQELLVVWVVAGPHGETPQAWCALSGDVGFVRSEVFRELRNGRRGVDGRTTGEIEDCSIATVGTTSGNLAAPHKCTAAAFGRNEDEVVILIFHDETLSVGWRHGEDRVAFTYQYKPDPQKVSTNELRKSLIRLFFALPRIASKHLKDI